MRYIFTLIFLVIISCSKTDISPSDKEYNKTETTIESQTKSNYNSFSFYEGQATYSINHYNIDRELSLIHI